jgi:hypothetical protein
MTKRMKTECIMDDPDAVPIFNAAAAKPFNLEEAQARDAASPWKKKWEDNGAPKPVETFESWKARKDAEKK